MSDLVLVVDALLLWRSIALDIDYFHLFHDFFWRLLHPCVIIRLFVSCWATRLFPQSDVKDVGYVIVRASLYLSSS